MTPENVKSVSDIELDADQDTIVSSGAPTRISQTAASAPAPAAHSATATTSPGAGPVIAGPAHLDPKHQLTKIVSRFASAPSGAQGIRALGELASAADNAADDRPFAVAVSAVSQKHKLGQTALMLSCIWGRWERSVCLLDLGTGRRNLEGAIGTTAITLDEAAQQAVDSGRVSGMSTLHARFPNVGLIQVGQGDPLGYVSSGKFGTLIRVLKQDFDRIVIAAPALESSFPFLSLGKSADRLVLSLVRGKSRGAPLREVCEHALMQGFRPIEAVWYD